MKGLTTSNLLGWRLVMGIRVEIEYYYGKRVDAIALVKTGFTAERLGIWSRLR